VEYLLVFVNVFRRSVLWSDVLLCCSVPSCRGTVWKAGQGRVKDGKSSVHPSLPSGEGGSRDLESCVAESVVVGTVLRQCDTQKTNYSVSLLCKPLRVN